MSSNRRQHTRNLKALDFSCYIDGQRFDARSLDVSVGGAFMETGALAPMGSVALIALKKGHPHPAGGGRLRRPRKELPIVLIGLVVRHQTVPVTGVGLRWLRCVSRVGLQPMYEFLGFVVDLYPSALPLPSGTVSTIDFVEFDFVLQEFRPGRAEDRHLDSYAHSAETSYRRRTPLAGTLRTEAVLATAKLQSNDAAAASKPEPPAGAPAEPQAATAPSASPLRPGPQQLAQWEQQQEAQHPAAPRPAPPPGPAADAFTAAMDELGDERPPAVPSGELTRHLEGSKELVYRPTKVEVVIGTTRARGVVHSLGRQNLLLATPGRSVASATRMLVRFPVPVRGQKITLDLHCAITAASPMKSRDAVSYDLLIHAVENEPAPGLWERWVRYLIDKRAFVG